MSLLGKGRPTTIYEWVDIRNELCEIMSIRPEDFRSYLEDPFQDLWHVWLDTFGYNISNDSIACTSLETAKEILSEQSFEDWQLPFFKAVAKLAEEVGPEIYINYSW